MLESRGHLVSLISCCRIQCGRGCDQDPRSDVHRMNTSTKSFDAELLKTTIHQPKSASSLDANQLTVQIILVPASFVCPFHNLLTRINNRLIIHHPINRIIIYSKSMLVTVTRP